jgi:hypothetical protein
MAPVEIGWWMWRQSNALGTLQWIATASDLFIVRPRGEIVSLRNSDCLEKQIAGWEIKIAPPNAK